MQFLDSANGASSSWASGTVNRVHGAETRHVRRFWANHMFLSSLSIYYKLNDKKNMVNSIHKYNLLLVHIANTHIHTHIHTHTHTHTTENIEGRQSHHIWWVQGHHRWWSSTEYPWWLWTSFWVIRGHHYWLSWGKKWKGWPGHQCWVLICEDSEEWIV